MTRVEVIALPSDVEVTADADLPALLLAAAADAGITLRDGDVIAVASKVVAKAESMVVPLPDAPDHHAGRRLLARQQARRVVADTPFVLVVETRHGFVCANAGIDTSNLPGGEEAALLLPDDPDASAAGLRAELVRRTGADVGVLVTDTFGRPWRLGLTDVALGAAGVEVLRDDRGTADREGRTLDVTITATADQLAAAADLVRTKTSGTPFVLLRGLGIAGTAFDGQQASDLLRPSEQDVFRTGGPTAGLDLLTRAAPLAQSPASLALDDEALAPLRAAASDAAPQISVDTQPGSQAALTLRGEPYDVGRATVAVAAAAAAFGWRVQLIRTETGATVRVGAAPVGS